ncbi:unnamed protein product [Brassicogethes aeneus]|uniref:Cysteine-rich DPF motif domain-containing protein 1 n=1 Tax=Brassicogethes aeneus TaxID=1431903 RepID=A0A9P0AWR9_BRAAE|nr:unnamed protein product [Brassicogethes aeneus]
MSYFINEESIKTEKPEKKRENEVDIKYFHCALCGLHEKFEYFGVDPPFVKKYKLLEDTYLVEDPFLPPKQGEMLQLGAHCTKCKKCVCKDPSCSFYYEGTYCIICAKENMKMFPDVVKDKLNKIMIN